MAFLTVDLGGDERAGDVAGIVLGRARGNEHGCDPVGEFGDG